MTGSEIPPGAPRRTRDVAAALLILAGIAGLAFVAFAAAPLAGCAVVSGGVLLVGLLLGMER